MSMFRTLLMQKKGGGEDYEFFDTLLLPELSNYIDCGINIGKVMSQPYTDLYFSFKNNSGKSGGVFLSGSATNRWKVYISNYVVRFAFGATSSTNVLSSLRNTNQKDAMIHVYGNKIDMTILSTMEVTSYDTVECATADYDIFLNLTGIQQSSRIFHSLKIENNGTVLHDIVPALRSDGVIGVLDKVTNAFYYSEFGQDYYTLSNTLS